MARERSEFSAAMVASVAAARRGDRVPPLIAWPWGRQLPVGTAVPVNIVAERAQSTDLRPAIQAAGGGARPRPRSRFPDRPGPAPGTSACAHPSTSYPARAEGRSCSQGRAEPVPKPALPRQPQRPRPSPRRRPNAPAWPRRPGRQRRQVRQDLGGQRSSAAKGPSRPETAARRGPTWGQQWRRPWPA